MNGVCGLEITPECEERPCLGCELFQRFDLGELVSIVYMETTEDYAADPVCLNDMTIEEQDEWFKEVQEVEF